MIKLVDLKSQHSDLKEDILKAVYDVVEESGFIKGPQLKRFLSNFANFCESKFAIGTSNGTTALEIALRSTGIREGDRVITVSHTFFATVEAILNVGAHPVFVDVDLSSGLINLEELENKMNETIKAVIPVHIYGHLANMPKIFEIANRFGSIVIEDAAQAHGARASWGGPGKYSSAATFSFFPGKNLGAWGDAGAIITNSESLAKTAEKLIDHGRLTKYEHDLIGTNARLDTLQAAILNVKLRKLNEWNLKRNVIASNFISKFEEHGFKIIKPLDSSSWHLFVVRVANREEVQSKMRDSGIETGIHYPIPNHKQPALNYEFGKNHLPNTELLSEEILSLPIHPYLSKFDEEEIIKTFLEIAKPTK